MTIVPMYDDRVLSEYDIRDTVYIDLQKYCKPVIEVETPIGRIDILTDTLIIEVKRARKWKHALGQILAYRNFKPGRKAILYLFGERIPKDKFYDAIKVCRSHGVFLYHHVKDTAPFFDFLLKYNVDSELSKHLNDLEVIKGAGKPLFGDRRLKNQCR